jgi:hypothetical protein
MAWGVERMVRPDLDEHYKIDRVWGVMREEIEP